MTATSFAVRDPLSIFVKNHMQGRNARPIPLVSTEFDVAIEAGLAVVTVKRVFENKEEVSIEAIMTFPVPVHAVLFDLRANIAGRTLIARAQRKDAARATYEGAVESGKSAVLHEEVLRGVHMLSVAHVPPAQQIEVTMTWAMPLTVVDGEGHLRIPLTVGEIYGRSPLADTDDLISGGQPQIGELAVRSSDSVVSLVGGFLENGRARVPMNRPIDLRVKRWPRRRLAGTGADGRRVSLELTPSAVASAPLSLAILVDHSGSMSEMAGSGPHGMTKHAAVRSALYGITDRLEKMDEIELWEFDNNAKRIGSTAVRGNGRKTILPAIPGARRRRMRDLIGELAGPSGGTEIGRALWQAFTHSEVRDILLITDGKSHALDIQELARRRHRISVVLIGEDSLEANVGHLASLTGGDIFVAGGADVAAVVTAAINGLRRRSEPLKRDEAVVAGGGTTQRAGMSITLAFDAPANMDTIEPVSRAVAAVAASLILPTLSETAAAELAEKAGLVSHLTSLVLVDRDGPSQEGIPSTIKIALPSPHDAVFMTAQYRAGRDLPPPAVFLVDGAVTRGLMPGLPILGRRHNCRFHGAWLSALDQLARLVDWDSYGQLLSRGDIDGLPADVRDVILDLAGREEIERASTLIGLAPALLIIVAAARRAGRNGSRQALRVAGFIARSLKEEQQQLLEQSLEHLLSDSWLA
jgi:hypothetical protein